MLYQPDCLGWTASVGARRLKVIRVSGWKCNFGPVFGQLYTDGFPDNRAADSYRVTLSFIVGESSPRCH